jgi:hypothetical protein
MLQAGRSRSNEVTDFLFSIYLVLPAATMTLWFTQPLTEMNARSSWLTTAICELNV